MVFKWLMKSVDKVLDDISAMVLNIVMIFTYLMISIKICAITITLISCVLFSSFEIHFFKKNLDYYLKILPVHSAQFKNFRQSIICNLEVNLLNELCNLYTEKQSNICHHHKKSNQPK